MYFSNRFKLNSEMTDNVLIKCVRIFSVTYIIMSYRVTLRRRQSQPSSHRKLIAATVCLSERLSVSWIACSLCLMPLLGCCAIGENMITLHRSSMMFYTGSQFLFASSLRSVCWCTSRFMGLRLGTCASIVRRRIHPL